MIKKILFPLILMALPLSMCGAVIENTEPNKEQETTIIDILYNDILMKIFSNANNLPHLNELLGKLTHIFPQGLRFLKEEKKPRAYAMRIINQYLENRFKCDYEKYDSKEYYVALKTLATISDHENILMLLNLAHINVQINKEKYDILNSNISDFTFLIKIGAELNITDPQGATALIMAAYHNNVKMVELLIKAGANLNIQSNSGDTALTAALILTTKKETIELLINAGADINIQNSDGNTALMLAIKNNDWRVSELLINAGADLEIQNDDGKTALALTPTKIHKRIILSDPINQTEEDYYRDTITDYVIEIDNYIYNLIKNPSLIKKPKT